MTVPAVRDGPHVAIACCTQCKWLLRAARMAQELLSTFETRFVRDRITPDRALGNIDRD